MSRYHRPQRENATIIKIWRRLADVRAFTFSVTAGPGSTTGWAGHGRGEVCVRRDTDAIRFFESGVFAPHDADTPIGIRNVYHWKRVGDRLSLGHERFGRDRPVALLEWMEGSERGLVSPAPHHCGADTYRGRLRLTDTGFMLYWRIGGPNKNETLAYHYSTVAA